MTDLSPGQDVTVSGSTGGPARLLYVRGESARVRMAATGRERTVPLDRVTAARVGKSLSVSADELAAARQLGMRHPSIPNPLTRPIGRDTSPPRPVPKPVTLRSEPYLAYVRKHPCCFCGNGPSEAHHWSHHGASTGKKVDDYRTVPLCDPCHMGEWHRTGAFPGMDRVASEALTLRVQRELLLAWTATRIDDGDMVDALIRAIGGQS